MFQIDDKFLDDLGLGQLPDEQKQAFREHIFAQLELRVGTILADGLTAGQLAEFENFINRDEAKVREWIGKNTPDYLNDQSYIQLRSGAPNVSEVVILSEYASLKWLSINRSDYKMVVAKVVEEIKQEIIANRDAILAS